MRHIIAWIDHNIKEFPLGGFVESPAGSIFQIVRVEDEVIAAKSKADEETVIETDEEIGLEEGEKPESTNPFFVDFTKQGRIEKRKKKKGKGSTEAWSIGLRDLRSGIEFERFMAKGPTDSKGQIWGLASHLIVTEDYARSRVSFAHATIFEDDPVALTPSEVIPGQEPPRESLQPPASVKPSCTKKRQTPEDFRAEMLLKLRELWAFHLSFRFEGVWKEFLRGETEKTDLEELSNEELEGLVLVLEGIKKRKIHNPRHPSFQGELRD